jgi:hypothetical protein
MKKAIYCLFFGVFFICAQTQSQEINNLNLAIKGDPQLEDSFEAFIKKYPKIKLPRSGVEYHIRVVEPDKSVDYKILEVEVDPNIDYMIRIIPPTRNQGSKPTDKELAEELLRRFKETRKNEEK